VNVLHSAEVHALVIKHQRQQRREQQYGLCRQQQHCLCFDCTELHAWEHINYTCALVATLAAMLLCAALLLQWDKFRECMKSRATLDHVVKEAMGG
jgi:hypothetical protein